jgi:vitamin B12 transporter
VSPDTGLGYTQESAAGGARTTGTFLFRFSVDSAIFSIFTMFQRGRLEFIQENQMKQKLLFTSLLCALTPFAHAETTSLDEIVVTATRMPQALNKTIADTTVLDEQEIRNSGAPDVATLLRSVAGIEVAQSGGLGSHSDTYMRGTNSNQVLVLIDGVRVNSATTGSTALEHIMLDNIERIEVVRGNVSSLYGSEAIGGVIQLFTKHGSGAPTFTASAGGGTHGTQRMAAGFSGEVDSTSFSVNASKVKTDGVSAINPQLAQNVNPNNNGYDNNTLNAQVKHSFNADHAVTASWFSTRSNISFDNSGGFASPTDQNNTQDNIDKVSLASDDKISEMWHSQVRIAQGTDDSQTYGASAYRYKTQSNQFAWQNNLKLADNQKLSLAVENLGQSVSSDTLYTQTTRNVNSLMGSYTGEYGAQQVQFNLRQDNYSDFGLANTGLLGYGYVFTDSWRATGSISSAFKAPIFNDLFAPASWGSNPNLKPERSQNQEIGLHYASNGHRVDAVYFDNRISDLIIYQYPMMMNINQAQITGQELSYARDMGNKHLKVNLTLQNPRNTTTDLVLARRAKEFASIAASHDLGEWNMGAELRYSGARQDSNVATSQTLPSYTLVNLTTKYTIDQHLSLSARVDNLFNADYSEVYSYNTLGRTLFVAVNYQ